MSDEKELNTRTPGRVYQTVFENWPEAAQLGKPSFRSQFTMRFANNVRVRAAERNCSTDGRPTCIERKSAAHKLGNA